MTNKRSAAARSDGEQRAFLGHESDSTGEFQHEGAHDARQHAVAERRRREPRPGQRKHVRDRGAGDGASGVQQQRIARTAFAGFARCQNVVEVGQRFEARGRRLLVATDGTGDERDRTLRQRRRPWGHRNRTRRRCGLLRPQAALGRAARDGRAQDAGVVARDGFLPIGPNGRCVDCDADLRRLPDQPREMALALDRHAVEGDQRVEHAIAEQEAAIVRKIRHGTRSRKARMMS